MLSRLRFKGVWRDYQAQVLEEIAGHLADDRLHVVAAPGAGKTILGLEIVRRLGRRALVFAPTVAIREQWAQRLTPLFLDDPPGPDDLSRDLAVPRPLTLATYQALDSLRRAGGLEDLIEGLNAAGPLTLVLDEAHHLRREWWNSLEQLARSLPGVQIIALTATPPYDAGFAEWARYESLCGPIDLEIGIPELVRNGDLCPHQDHVILSEPTANVLLLLDQRRRAVGALLQELREDEEFIDRLATHPWMVRPRDHVEAILEAPEMLSAMLVLLKSAGRRAPAAPLKLLGTSASQIPIPSFAWFEILLNGVTGRQAAAFPIGEARLKDLRDRLHRLGLIEGGRARLRHARSIFRMMASSLAKLDSVADIARAEEQVLGERLRLVVLSDHIRAEELPASEAGGFRPAKLGVVTIFEHLRRAGIAEAHLGVLTGTLVILPQAVLPALRAVAAEHRVDADALRACNLAGCPGYARVELVGTGAAGLVPLVTTLFARGDVRVLVGTQSLLGEGWDAPAVNSLILASNTASFMLSNQMRGRAIRIDPENPDKVANIWHLATVEPGGRGLLAEQFDRLNWGDLRDEEPDGLSDAALLARRFRAFEGLPNGASTLIESGIGRLGLSLSGEVHQTNQGTLAAAANRADVARRWRESLGVGAVRARVRETAAPNYAPRVLAVADTVHALVWSGLSAAGFAAADELRGVDSFETLGALGMAVAGAAALAGLPDLFKAVRLLWRNGSVEASLRQVAGVVLDSLVEAGLVGRGERGKARIEVRSTLDGRKDIVVLGVSRSTERQVMQAISEALGPVENPRYLLLRRSRLGWRLRTDYHAVPAALAARKAWAERFAALWRQRVGTSRLIYTRTAEGRRILLRARAKSFAAGFQRSVDRRSAWL